MADIEQYIRQLCVQARRASQALVDAAPAVKNSALYGIAEKINTTRDLIKRENERDMQQGRLDNLSDAMMDRLHLTEARIDTIVEGLHQVAQLADPVGEISEMKYRPNGIQIGRMRVPLGVIGIIYESRPNVTIDAAALCLKSSNASILRGGKEAIHSNQAIDQCIQAGLSEAGLPPHVIQVVNTIDRAAVGVMLSLPEYVDVIIPRGGKSLIERITRESKISVIKHLDGNCHVYVDDQADLAKAFDIAVNAKSRRYGVCNAMETLLVAEAVASVFLPRLIAAMVEKGIELRGCPKTQALNSRHINAATEADWDTEYLGPILAIKIVADMNEAINHINRHGSQHTDAIVSENYTRTREFLRRVNSSSVMVNASTAFADGFEYGLGAEIGISTNKLHVRGPVGLEGLTTQKYIVLGDGHIRP